MEEEATEIVKLKDLSGARWDEDKSMIVLDHEHYTNHVKAHPEDEQYLNKTIIHYKEMMYIAGGSMAIGQYAKDSSDPLSTEVVNLEEET
uniref:Myb/SANT-like domain-containing protein n=2 Tax=Aegilops tauschii subsp. strangulata TaxID=200361 RepID=A0A453EXH7_AEGTS